MRRLHDIDDIAPSDKLAGRAEAIHAARENKHQLAQARRQARDASGGTDNTRRKSLTPIVA